MMKIKRKIYAFVCAIDSKDSKDLRYEYLHWSVKANKFGLVPRFDEVLSVEKRKRQIQNGII